MGGGSRSPYWAQLLATLLECPLVVRTGAEAAAALGAARLAWLADGGDEQEVCKTAPERRRFEPEPEHLAGLLERHQRFRQLYPKLQDLWAG